MSRDKFAEGINEIRSSWGWFLALGILLVVFGSTCVLRSIATTFVTVRLIGWLLLVGGVFALIQAFQVRTWNGFFLFLLNALWRGCTGYVLIRHPDVGAASLTLILASFFIVGGLFRATGPAMLRLPRWGWATLSGILTFALGIMLLLQWPLSGVWFIGFAIGVDMISDGASLVAFSRAIHSLPKIRAVQA
jgi:uncharacterized membrane protein HdeD (DUF308 family)